MICDELTTLPLLHSVYPLIEKHIQSQKQIGFIYFDIIQFHKIQEKYSRNICEDILRGLGQLFCKIKETFLREEDIIAVSGQGHDDFLIFIFSPPRHKDFFGVADLKLIAYRIEQKLEESINDNIKNLHLKDPIEFHIGYTLINADPNLPIDRVVYEAQREASLKCRMEEIMTQFVSNISHELRTPLTCIKGYVETLLEGAMTNEDTLRRFLSIINEETQRLERLINDLLDLSIMESRKIKMHLGEIHIAPLVEDTANFLATAVEKKNLTISTKIIGTVSTIYADEDRLQQVLMNLIDNAIKYTPQGGNITISAKEDDGFVTVSVADTGMGIPYQDQERIFERFYRVEKERSSSSGGRGLGLAIAKHIIDGHGGIIGVKSEPGNGSTFYFSLPTKATWDEGE